MVSSSCSKIIRCERKSRTLVIRCRLRRGFVIVLPRGMTGISFEACPHLFALDIFMVFDTGTGRRPGFPSYSLIGWHGWLRFMAFYHDDTITSTMKMNWLKGSTWITWYQIARFGRVSLVWNPLGHAALNHVASAPTITSFSRCKLDIDMTQTTPSEVIVPPDRLYPLLQFWTITVHYKLHLPGARGHADEDFHILDYEDIPCTRLIPNPGHERWSGQDQIELIILSKCWYDPWVQQELVPSSSLDSESNTRSCYDADYAYWALCIRWNDKIAERVGLAFIFQDALRYALAPGPIWKEIVLG